LRRPAPGQPFEGIHAAAPAIAAVLREATFTAFDRIIDLAIEETVDFIVVAGDVHDGENRSLRAQLRFRDAIRKAGDAGLRCFVAHGNHDPSPAGKPTWRCRRR